MGNSSYLCPKADFNPPVEVGTTTIALRWWRPHTHSTLEALVALNARDAGVGPMLGHPPADTKGVASRIGNSCPETAIEAWAIHINLGGSAGSRAPLSSADLKLRILSLGGGQGGH